MVSDSMWYMGSSFVSASVSFMGVICFLFGLRRFGVKWAFAYKGILACTFLAFCIWAFLLELLYGEIAVQKVSLVGVLIFFSGILFWVVSLANCLVRRKPYYKNHKVESTPLKGARNSTNKAIDGFALNRGKKEFPYKAELKRRVFSYIVDEEKDIATILRAKMLCGSKKHNIAITYYKLRYQQMLETGELNKLEKEILKNM